MTEQKHGGPGVEERQHRDSHEAMSDLIDNQAGRHPFLRNNAAKAGQGRLRRMRARLRTGNIFRVFPKGHRSVPWLRQGNNLPLVILVVTIGVLIYLSAPG